MHMVMDTAKKHTRGGLDEETGGDLNLLETGNFYDKLYSICFLTAIKHLDNMKII